MKAYIGSIQHFSIHDGKGIRSVVFFQGCGLECKWCQNPELLSKTPILLYNQELCSGCKNCVNLCNAIFSLKSKIKIDRKKCTNCFKCVDKCYYSALECSSKYMSVDDIVKEVIKDESFYKTSGGGITLSGGEPLLNIDFTLELAKKVKEKGISVNIETAGFISWRNFEKIIPYVDTFLYDIKLISNDAQKKYLGNTSNLLQGNLEKLVRYNANVIVRIPLIPYINDGAEFIKIVKFLKEIPQISLVHIMPFHQIGSNKYNLIDKKYQMKNISDYNSINIQKCKNMLLKAGKVVDIGGNIY